jgi:hypothetical protein
VGTRLVASCSTPAFSTPRGIPRSYGEDTRAGENAQRTPRWRVRRSAAISAGAVSHLLFRVSCLPDVLAILGAYRLRHTPLHTPSTPCLVRESHQTQRRLGRSISIPSFSCKRYRCRHRSQAETPVTPWEHQTPRRRSPPRHQPRVLARRHVNDRADPARLPSHACKTTARQQATSRTQALSPLLTRPLFPGNN